MDCFNWITLIVSIIATAATVVATVYTIRTYCGVTDIKKSLDAAALDTVYSLPEIEMSIRRAQDYGGNVFFMSKKHKEYIDIEAREKIEDNDHTSIVGRFRFYKDGIMLFKQDLSDGEYYPVEDD